MFALLFSISRVFVSLSEYLYVPPFDCLSLVLCLFLKLTAWSFFSWCVCERERRDFLSFPIVASFFQKALSSSLSCLQLYHYCFLNKNEKFEYCFKASLLFLVFALLALSTACSACLQKKKGKLFKCGLTPACPSQLMLCWRQMRNKVLPADLLNSDEKRRNLPVKARE